MSDYLRGRLETVFAQAEETQARSDNAVEGQRHRESTTKARFDELKKAWILPLIEQVRDFLLEKNMPAGILTPANEESERSVSDYIALIAAAKPESLTTLPVSFKFSVGFYLVNGGIEVRITVPDDTLPVQRFSLEDFTKEQIEEILASALEEGVPRLLALKSVRE